MVVRCRRGLAEDGAIWERDMPLVTMPIMCTTEETRFGMHGNQANCAKQRHGLRIDLNPHGPFRHGDLGSTTHNQALCISNTAMHGYSPCRGYRREAGDLETRNKREEVTHQKPTHMGRYCTAISADSDPLHREYHLDSRSSPTHV